MGLEELFPPRIGCFQGLWKITLKRVCFYTWPSVIFSHPRSTLEFPSVFMDFTGAFGPSPLFKDKALSSPSLHADHTELISWSLDWPKLFNHHGGINYQTSDFTWLYIITNTWDLSIELWTFKFFLFLIQEPSIRFSCNHIYIYVYIYIHIYIYIPFNQIWETSIN